MLALPFQVQTHIITFMANENIPITFYKMFADKNDLSYLKHLTEGLSNKDFKNLICSQATSPTVSASKKETKKSDTELKITDDFLVQQLKNHALFSGSNCFFGHGDDYDYFLNSDDEIHIDIWNNFLNHLNIKEENLINFEVEANYKFINFKARHGAKLLNVIYLNQKKFEMYDKATQRFKKLIKQYPELAQCLSTNKDMRLSVFHAFKASQGTLSKATLL